MKKHVHIHLHGCTVDAAKWDESQHPRKDNGEFGAGSGGKKAPAEKREGTGAAGFTGAGRGNEIAHHRELATQARKLGRTAEAEKHERRIEELKRDRMADVKKEAAPTAKPASTGKLKLGQHTDKAGIERAAREQGYTVKWTGDPKGKPVFVERDLDHGDLEVYADEGGGSSVMVGKISNFSGGKDWKA